MCPPQENIDDHRLRGLQYYETDRMGITHHSNYIRFMEEARTEWMESMGMGYDEFESLGLTSPMLSVSCNYKKPTTYGDHLDIAIYIQDCAHLKIRVAYVMTCRGEVVCTGESSHCIMDANGRPVSLKKSYPELYANYEAYHQNQGDYKL